MPFGMEKLEWCGYPMVKNLEDMFIHFDRMYERDGHTDTAWWHRPRLHSIARHKRTIFKFVTPVYDDTESRPKYYISYIKLFSFICFIRLVCCMSPHLSILCIRNHEIHTIMKFYIFGWKLIKRSLMTAKNNDSKYTVYFTNSPVYLA